MYIIDISARVRSHSHPFHASTNLILTMALAILDPNGCKQISLRCKNLRASPSGEPLQCHFQKPPVLDAAAKTHRAQASWHIDKNHRTALVPGNSGAKRIPEKPEHLLGEAMDGSHE